MRRTGLVSLLAAERAMKVGEVIELAVSGQVKWYQAAEILGLSSRQMRRWKERYQGEGLAGLVDRRKDRPSPKRLAPEVAAKVLELYREQYFDFNVKHFHEQLAATHGIHASYTWTKSLLHDTGLIRRGKKRGQYRRRRERKPLPGLLVHLDGSTHRWFESAVDERQDLLALVDDATGEILAARFVPQEGTFTCLELILELVERRGTFNALYTDRAMHFVYTPRAGEPPDRSHKSQIERVLRDLGIELIAAHSPEARGRSERVWGTLQGRLPQELRRAHAVTYEAANRYLNKTFIPAFNRRFAVPPAEQGDAFLPVVGFDLKRLFACRYERTVSRDNTIRFNNRPLQLPKVSGLSTLADRKVEVRILLDRTLEVLHGKRLIATFAALPLLTEDELRAV